MENPSLPHYHGEEPAHTEVVRQMLEKEDTFQALSDIFRQLGDANRIRIFWLLCHCEEYVVNIAAMMDMSSPAVSHHLRILRDSGLLTTRRDGKEVYYHAADTAQARLLHELIEQVMDVACPQWRAEAEQVRLIRENPRLPAVAHGPAYHHRGPLPSVPHQPDHIERGVQGCVRHLHRCPPERAPHGEGRPPPP